MRGDQQAPGQALATTTAKPMQTHALQSAPWGALAGRRQSLLSIHSPQNPKRRMHGSRHLRPRGAQSLKPQTVASALPVHACGLPLADCCRDGSRCGAWPPPRWRRRRRGQRLGEVTRRHPPRPPGPSQRGANKLAPRPTRARRERTLPRPRGALSGQSSRPSAQTPAAPTAARPSRRRRRRRPPRPPPAPRAGSDPRPPAAPPPPGSARRAP
mmetsp:Transcript_35215/g.97399  ORF Transcript_35215/g.97399 Transcript_35215/m.97399 type:complete len:213 (+) Transcript_35215:106-744(+)